jgi:hypothetical protein
MIIIAAVGAIAGCPYDETAADITAGDGGIWIGDPNDGGFLFPQTDGGAVYIAKAPSLNTLCKLVVGDYGPVQDMNAPRFLGTWIGDVESSLFFGPPAPNSEQLRKDNALVLPMGPSVVWKGSRLGEHRLAEVVLSRGNLDRRRSDLPGLLARGARVPRSGSVP